MRSELGPKFGKFLRILALGLSGLCLAAFGFAQTPSSTSQPQIHPKTKTDKTNTRKKAAKESPPLPPLPSGPTGPVQQVPLDSMAPVPPQVSYQNAQLTIVAPNSTLGDILRAVHKQTGAEIEIPAANDRVVTHLGPGPAPQVMAELLNGSRFNYVLLASPADNTVLTRVVLVPKAGPDSATSNTPALAEQQGGMPHPGTAIGESAEPEATEDEAADQAAAEAEQPQPPPDQPGVKTPQQMLQEMQQRQLQLQQQQQNGAGGVPVPRPQ